MTSAQWNRLQQTLPPEDRMTYAEYLVAIGEAPAAVTPTAVTETPAVTEVVDNLTRVADAAAVASTASTSAAEAARLKAIEDAANAEYARTMAAANESANSNMVNGKLMGPSQFSKDGKPLEFKPMTEGARLAIFGLNPATGKAYTDAESAAASGGYIPEGYKNIQGYRFDPTTGALEVLGGNGTTSGLGTGYRMNAKGNILPDQNRLPKGVGIDENGKYYQPGERMPGESTAQLIKRLSQIGQGVFFENGKAIQYDSAGRFYIDGQEPMPEGFGQAPVVDQAVAGLSTTTGPVAGKTVSKTTKNANGTTTYLYTDGTSSTGAGSGNSINNPFEPGSDAAKAWNERKSAYDLLYSEFNKYGLGTLIEPLRNLVQEGVSPSEFAIQLRNTPQYQKRFAANAKRVQNGLAALSEAEYIGLEDQYQNIMRNYGLPEQYYARGDLGVQAGFEQFIGNDVSPVELEDRIQTAERRVRYANPEVGIALKTFYPDITNGDVLAYALDPKTALESLKRRITAAEVGSTAVQMGLATNVTDAEYLARYGVTKAQAQQGYQTISNFLPRAQQLSDIYATQGVNPYTQATAEKEVFGIPGAADAAAQRKKIVGLETAAFSGSSGAAGGALARERAGGF
jgi:hypothetical protein